jgi:hypothetical protein
MEWTQPRIFLSTLKLLSDLALDSIEWPIFFLETNRVHASLVYCIKLAENTLHAERYEERTQNGIKTYWKSKEP